MKYDLSNEMSIKKARVYLESLIEKGKQVEIKAISGRRTNSQNAYLHVLISLYAMNFGYTLAEAKELLKRECSFMQYEKKGKIFLTETRGLTKEEMTKFIEWIRNHSASHGCYLPTSEEYLFNKISIDNEIEYNLKYL